MNPVLHHDLVRAEGATPRRWIIMAAGIFGTGRNWAAVARRLVRDRSDWGCILVDLRQHGDSTGFEPPHTVRACAEDLLALAAHLRLDVGGILGHSFGGKVALSFSQLAAADAAGPFIESVWVIDSTPARGTPEGSVWRMLQVLHDRPGPFSSRTGGVAAVEEAGFSTPVAQWMSTNLVPWTRLSDAARERWRTRAAPATGDAARRGDGAEPADDDLVWRLDADDMEALLRSFFDTELWSAVEHAPPGTEIHLVKAEESSVLDEEACARVEAAALAHGGVHLHRVPGGHWVNADAPDELHELLVAELP